MDLTVLFYAQSDNVHRVCTIIPGPSNAARSGPPAVLWIPVRRAATIPGSRPSPTWVKVRLGDPARAIVQTAARSLEPFSNPNIFGLSDGGGRINLDLAIEMQRRPDPLSPLIMDIAPDHSAFL